MFTIDSTRALVRLALNEDIGRGDCTTEAVIQPDLQATATVYVKQPAKLAGVPLINAVFAELDAGVCVTPLMEDGQDIDGRSAVCSLKGPARSILIGERTALNFLGRLTGIATLTSVAVRELAGTQAKLLDTRKTTPGWRLLEKYAVRTGGGHNHRFGLDDMVLIKDNHIALCGGVAEAVALARANVGLSQKIEVEVDTLAQLKEALETSADMILLDNMNLDEMCQAVKMANGRVPLEASGNVTIRTLAQVAQTGVDYISMGALTHSATSVDVGLDIVFL
ncbi:carboxylating nicotinate-nucleotide diphosphorylase [Alicyclobacillus fastidiosus]|uniref:nicotinate-nucleotide diphosphorylase (carboxylating) n=1 Tax=Alicyclobacillus fastidiosus TaxID=392011 RepID=A0ABY6ZD79_9BACL|nr:carboxylating nicotinate-nucleotide diphosphorylase [Alicyclobacillus fastidiosus]WAH40797.1 carboxylating nicotinate-nucleotide diphosphorylase [Alicyclobacillus fastidiosus]GMA62278.1 nicotinate-nucleotide diphosphorylase (carboxylating) [Alicyclobacillus fastidiosus]